MSSIEKQKNGHYRARYRDPNGRTRSVTFGRLEDARRFLAGLGGALMHGEFVDPARARTNFEEWAELWWGTTVRLRPTTRRGYRGHLDRHVLPYFAGRKVGAIDYATVETFIANRYGAGLSAKMVRESLSVLSMVLQMAVKANALSTNPAAGHRVPVPRRTVQEGDVLDMAQVVRLVENVRDPYKPAVWLLALAGLRPSELCGLRVRDVDFVRHTVTVRSTLTPVHPFAGETSRLCEGPPKTSAGKRTIPVPAWLCDDLAVMLAARGGVERDGWLFQTRYGTPVNSNHFRDKVVLPALRAAGLPVETRTYDLRHSHASLLIDLGANPLAVAQRMGHSDPSITLRVYGHLFEGTQAKLSEQLDALREAATSVTKNADVIGLDNWRSGTRTGHA